MKWYRIIELVIIVWESIKDKIIKSKKENQS